LCYFTFETITLHTEESGIGEGAGLSVTRNGRETPPAYISRQLRGDELSYSTTELEALENVAAIQRYFIKKV